MAFRLPACDSPEDAITLAKDIISALNVDVKTELTASHFRPVYRYARAIELWAKKQTEVK